MGRVIIFDYDDVLFPLNERVCAKVGLDYHSINTFNVNEWNVPRELAMACNAMYHDPNTFKNADWYDGVEHLFELEELGAEVYIKTKCYSDDIWEVKYGELRKEFVGVPDSRFIYCKEEDKGIGTDTFAFVDDCTPHMVRSLAQYNIMPIKPWNIGVADRRLVFNKDIIRTDTFLNTYRLLERLLKAYTFNS